MNDPCGAAYVPETNEYLLCYQLGATVDSFADAWGCCVSKDLVHWHDLRNAIEPGPGKYDELKVFSGSILSRHEPQGTVLYLYYTSVRHLPISWKREYRVGCESQSLAISRDFGRSWKKVPDNPLLREPVTGSRTTGWRDPFVSVWSSMSKLLGLPATTSYLLLSSGTKDFGPRLVLYKSSQLSHWEEVGPIFSPKAKDSLFGHSDLHYGHNFECGSFFTLDEREYLIFGVEADSKDNDRHAQRWTMWLSGSLVLNDAGMPVFSAVAAGTLDHDILYAVHVTKDAEQQLLQYGWLDEDDNTSQHDQQWAGCIALPRQISTLTLPLAPDLLDKSSWIVDEETKRMTTLSIRPHLNCSLLREGATVHIDDFASIKSECFEFIASFHAPNIDKIIFTFRMSQDGREATQLVIDLVKHAISLDRTRSSVGQGSRLCRSGHFQIFEEALQLRVFCDNSVVEVFANDRFSMSSRIYPSPTSLGMQLTLQGDEQDVAAMQYTTIVYDGLSRAWPHRQEHAG